MNNKEFCPQAGDNTHIDEDIRKLRTETAFSIKRSESDMLGVKGNEKGKFEDQIKKIMTNLGKVRK